jgi:hypothetical protein
MNIRIIKCVYFTVTVSAFHSPAQYSESLPKYQFSIPPDSSRFPFPGVACYIRLGLMLTCAGGAVFSYLLMAVHRFVVIVLNRPRMRIFSVPWLALLLPCLWLVAVVSISPYYYLGDVFVVYWRDNCFPWSPSAVKVMEIVTLVYIYLPTVVSCTLYVAIYVVVRQSSARIQTAGKRERKEVKMALVLFGLLTLFIVAYFPYCTYLSLQRYMSVPSQKLYLLTGLFTALTISACNPLVFAAIFKPMQQRYLEIFGCKRLATNKVSVAPATESSNTAT